MNKKCNKEPEETPTNFLLNLGKSFVWLRDVVTVGATTYIPFDLAALNDGTIGGAYVGSDNAIIYYVDIAANGTPDTFTWIKTGGATSSPINIVAGPIALDNGITVTFGADTGHTIGDQWNSTISIANPLSVQNAGSTSSLWVGNNNKVGIGTITPFNSLDVVGNISCSVITASLFFGTASVATTANALNVNNNYKVNTLTASNGLLVGPGADRSNTGLYVSASSTANSSIVEVDDAYGNEVLVIGPSGSFATTNYQLTGSYTTTYTNSYTISSLDDGKLVVINSGSAVTVTLTTSSINNGFNAIFYQSGSGAITFTTASTAVVLRNRQSQYKSAGLYAMVSLIRVPDGSFVLGGDTGV